MAIRYNKLILAAGAGLLFSACIKNDGKVCSIMPSPKPVNFNVVDASTRQDLFFSANPQFALKDLYFFRRADKSRKDTIRPEVLGSGNSRYFRYDLSNIAPKDTLYVKVGNLPDAILVYHTIPTGRPCTADLFDKLFFNGLVVKPNEGGVYVFVR